MRRRRTTTTRRTTKRRSRTAKSKLAGYTRVKGKYALVYKKGGKLVVGKGRFAKKASLLTAARRSL